MRKVVITEGKRDGKSLYYVSPGALTCSREYIPVSVYGDASGENWPRGRASGFARDESTGEISFEIEMEHPSDDSLVKDWDASIFISPLERETSKDVVLKGEIRGITLVPDLEPAVPKE